MLHIERYTYSGPQKCRSTDLLGKGGKTRYANRITALLVASFVVFIEMDFENL